MLVRTGDRPAAPRFVIFEAWELVAFDLRRFSSPYLRPLGLTPGSFKFRYE